MLAELSFPHAIHSVTFASPRLFTLLVYVSTYCVPIAHLRQNKPFCITLFGPRPNNYDSWWQHQMSVRELRHDRSGRFSKSRGLSASVSFLSSPPPPRSFTCTIFRAVFVSCSSFFAPKPHRNVYYAGRPILTAWAWASAKKNWKDKTSSKKSQPSKAANVYRNINNSLYERRIDQVSHDALHLKARTYMHKHLEIMLTWL